MLFVEAALRGSVGGRSWAGVRLRAIAGLHAVSCVWRVILVRGYVAKVGEADVVSSLTRLLGCLGRCERE